MASSNRHWPSMFKSKPISSNTHHQWQQHDMINSSLVSRGGPFSSVCEERSPEPKPRWNPKPEQIRILEAIFNSGMVNPPRDEIRRIRGQLQEYGQVGDANVFYWFQNRKSRSKNKNRHQQHLQNPKNAASQNPKITTHNNSSPPNNNNNNNNNVVTIMPCSSSSSSSDKSFSSQDNNLNNNSPSTVSMNHHHHQPPYFFTSSQGELIAPDPFLFQQVQQQQHQHHQQDQQQFSSNSQGFCFSDLSNVVHMSGGGGGGGNNHHQQQNLDPQGGFLLSELMMNNNNNNNGTNHEVLAVYNKKVDDEKIMKLQNDLCFSNFTHQHTPIIATATTTTTTTSQTVASLPFGLNQYQGSGVGESGGMGGGGQVLLGSSARSTVFINDVAFEVSCDSGINVRECFGDDAVLLHSTGQPVAINDWSVTLNPLIHGATYFLVFISSDIS